MSKANMPKPRRKTIPKKPIIPRLLLWWAGWKLYIKSRGRHLGSQFLGCLGLATFIVFVLVAVLYFGSLAHSQPLPQDPETLEWWTQMIMLAIIFYAFVGAFALLFILSLHPKTRKIADKLIGFVGKTELDKLKEKVEGMEKDLQETKSKLGDIEKHLKGKRRPK